MPIKQIAARDIFPGQYRWDPLEYQDQCHMTAEQAMRAARADRDQMLKMVRKARPDLECRGWRLTGQLRPYHSFGVPDGRIRTVYYASVAMKGNV